MPPRDGTSADDAATERDRQAISALFNTYFFFYDRGDEAGLNLCFTEDAEAQFDIGGPEPVILEGRDAIVRSMAGAAARRLGANHMPSNMRIELDGDRATSDMFAIAHIILGNDQSSRVLVRGLRYLDEIVRTPAGWRISKRIHKALWQYEAPTVRPEVSS